MTSQYDARHIYAQPSHLQCEREIERGVFEAVEAAGGAAVSGAHVGFQKHHVVLVFSARSLAIHFAGSQ